MSFNRQANRSFNIIGFLKHWCQIINPIQCQCRSWIYQMLLGNDKWDMVCLGACYIPACMPAVVTRDKGCALSTHRNAFRSLPCTAIKPIAQICLLVEMIKSAKLQMHQKNWLLNSQYFCFYASSITGNIDKNLIASAREISIYLFSVS